MSACHDIAISASADDRLLSGNGERVESMACVFVISRSAVRVRTLASLSPQQDNISLFVSFGRSRIAISGFAHLSRNLDRNTKKNFMGVK